MQEFKIIGLAGRMGVGKTSLARMLRDIFFTEYDISYSIMSFADPLRDMVSRIILENVNNYKHCDVFVDNSFKVSIFTKILRHVKYSGITVKDTVLDELWKKISFVQTYDQLYRILLQYIGTNIYRKCVSENFWVDEVKKRVSNKNVIFDDVRFKNEIEYINGQSGIVVCIDSTNIISSYNLHHESETNITYQDCMFSYMNDHKLGLVKSAHILFEKIINYNKCNL